MTTTGDETDGSGRTVGGERARAADPAHDPDAAPADDQEPTREAQTVAGPPRARAWPWVLTTVALVGLVVVVGVGTFAALSLVLGGTLTGTGALDDDTGVVVLEDGTVVEDGGAVDDGLAEGTAYGDNPELDALWDGCEGGDAVSCDALYNTSAVGSEYESFGQTCGGRVEVDAWTGTCEGETG